MIGRSEFMAERTEQLGVMEFDRRDRDPEFLRDFGIAQAFLL